MVHTPQLELDRLKAAKTKRPDPGASRPGQLGTGGRVGATGGSLLTQHILKQQVRPAGPAACALNTGPCAA